MADSARYVIYMPSNEMADCYPITVSAEADVQTLIYKIREHDELKHIVGTDPIYLYVCGELTMDPGKELYYRARDWLPANAEKRRMRAAFDLHRCFPKGPAPKQSLAIDVIAATDSILEDLGIIKFGAKRPFQDVVEYNKRPRLSTTSPSEYAKSSQYKTFQAMPSERIFDDRPVADKDVPPMALLYDGFGHFLDIFHGRTKPPVLMSRSFEEAVNDFALQMTGFFKDEQERRVKGLGKMNEIFLVAMDVAAPHLIAGSVGSVTTDGHALGNNDVACCVVEFKNEACGTSAIPEIQLTSYVAHIHHAALQSSGKEVEGQRIPCLGITVVGDGYDRQALRLAFAAAADLRSRLQRTRMQPEPSVHPTLLRLPYVSRLRTHGSSSTYLDFRIREWYYDRQDYRLLYIAVTTAGEEILVKFTKRYSIELHAFCANKGHAPAIRAFEMLPGGWHALAMEYVKSAVPLSIAPAIAENGARWEKELTDLVAEFHACGFVHGDLRDPNILCNPDSSKILLIDFDWGGKVNEAYYHTALLNSELTVGRNRSDLLITPEDDIRVLHKTLESVRRKYSSRI